MADDVRHLIRHIDLVEAKSKAIWECSCGDTGTVSVGNNPYMNVREGHFGHVKRARKKAEANGQSD